ncbi:MAG: putative zinc-binding protein [Promethearchaeia archaeon]
MRMTEEHKIKWEAGKNTHENIIYVCFGGLSNTGITAGLASIEAVKELGLDKSSIGCLAGLPTNVKSVLEKTNAIKKVITVDGCPMECSRKIVEAAGFPIAKSIVLVRDIGMSKKPLHEDVASGDLKGLSAYINEEEIQRAKEYIVNSLKST